jgi:VWFA-related protein
MISRQWIILTLMIAAGSIAAISQTIIKAKTEEVRIDAFVAADNIPIQGLNASDFEIRDNGIPQTIAYAGFEKVPVNAVLVFDMSSSITGQVLENLKTAGNKLLDGLAQNDQAALITFSQTIKLEAPLTADITQIKNKLNALRAHAYNNTSLIDACYAAFIHAETKADRPLIILFSDGLDNASWLEGNAVLDSARRNNSVIYAVSAGRLPNKTFLRELSTATGGSLYEVESPNDLNAVFLNILKEFRQRYLLTYAPQNVASGGWHKIEVRVKHRSATVRTRSGYFSDSTP